MIIPVKAKRGFDNEEKWGRLVLGWIRGKSQFPNIADDLSLPKDLADLKRQLAVVGVELDHINEVKALTVIRDAGDALVIRLPAADAIESAIEQLKQTEYAIPQFYVTFGDGVGLESSAAEQPDLMKDKMKLLACRVGDYSIAQCV